MAAARPCPLCLSSDASLFLEERLKPSAYNQFTYASRKRPEFMNHRLLRCLSCDGLYAADPPDDEFLSLAYGQAAYDSGPEAACAASAYRAALEKQAMNKDCALDVGAGDGAMLAEYLKMGFQAVVGIEPSRSAIAAAPDEIRPLLRPGLFAAEQVRDIQPTLISSFMTLEHLRDPAGFLRAACDLLQPGGLVAVVGHDWRAWLHRLLGRRSPIIDVEHLQLFSARSITALLAAAGFKDISIRRLQNRYPLAYWLRLGPPPLPGQIGVTARKFVQKNPRLSRLTFSFNVGNIMALGVKP